MKKIVFLLVSTLTIGVTLYALFHPEFFRVHDFTQGARIIEMVRGFQDGQIPVRWSQNFGFGYGMPTFLFYGPFPYMVGALVYWLTQNLTFSLKFIWALPSVLSFFGMYRFARRYMGQSGALIAAVSFTLAPYRAVDLYVRGAVGEVWGIALFPWLLWSVDRWFDNPKRIDVKLTLLTGLLFTTHNLMAMLFMPLVFLYGGLKWVFTQKRDIKQAALFTFQLILGVGMSAFFILPAVLEKDLTQINERILTGYFSYTQHFVYIRQFFKENWKYAGSVWGPDDELSFFLGYGQLIMLALLAVLVASLVWRRISFRKFLRKHRDVLPLVILVSAFLPISLFLNTEKSSFIWNISRVLQTAQFPWRFLSLSIFCLALLNGLVFRFRIHKRLEMILFTIAFVALLLPSFKYFRPDGYLANADALYYTDAARIRHEMSETWPDFLPKNFNANLPATDVRYQLTDAQSGEVEVLIDRSHQLLLRTDFDQPTTLILNIADFPGWSVFINDTENTFSQNSDGLISVEVPAGSQLVGAEFRRTPIRLVADLITVASIMIIIGSQIIFPKISSSKNTI
jgi:hypothetical protein